jgi:hypothetical protein
MLSGISPVDGSAGMVFIGAHVFGTPLNRPAGLGDRLRPQSAAGRSSSPCPRDGHGRDGPGRRRTGRARPHLGASPACRWMSAMAIGWMENTVMKRIRRPSSTSVTPSSPWRSACAPSGRNSTAAPPGGRMTATASAGIYQEMAMTPTNRHHPASRRYRQAHPDDSPHGVLRRISPKNGPGVPAGSVNWFRPSGMRGVTIR